MSEKLFTLCQLQLGSIAADLEQAMAGVNAAAGRLLQTPQGRSCSDLRAIVVGLQFQDELAQRLQHVQSLLQLLAEQDHSAIACSKELLARVSHIFSSKAEFAQLDKVFPGCHDDTDTGTVELF